MVSPTERLLIKQLDRIVSIIDTAPLLGYDDYVIHAASKILYEYKRQLSLESAKGQFVHTQS